MRRKKTLNDALNYIEARTSKYAFPKDRIPKFRFRYPNPNGAPVLEYSGYHGFNVSETAPQFILRPDPPKRNECSFLRKERISPLTIIAQKWEERETFNPYPRGYES